MGFGYFYINKKNVLSCGTSTTIPDNGRLKIIILWFCICMWEDQPEKTTLHI